MNQPDHIRVRSFFYFTKCLLGNLENTTENDKERLSTSIEQTFCKKFHS